MFITSFYFLKNINQINAHLYLILINKMAQGYLTRKILARKFFKCVYLFLFIVTKLFLKSESLILFKLNKLMFIIGKKPTPGNQWRFQDLFQQGQKNILGGAEKKSGMAESRPKSVKKFSVPLKNICLFKCQHLFGTTFALIFCGDLFGGRRKILNVGRSPEVSWCLPHLPPLTAFFKFQGGILRGGAYAPNVLKQGVHMHPLPHGSARHCWQPRI